MNLRVREKRHGSRCPAACSTHYRNPPAFDVVRSVDRSGERVEVERETIPAFDPTERRVRAERADLGLRGKGGDLESTVHPSAVQNLDFHDEVPAKVLHVQIQILHLDAQRISRTTGTGDIGRTEARELCSSWNGAAEHFYLTLFEISSITSDLVSSSVMRLMYPLDTLQIHVCNGFAP